jgi:TetR/AcrR family transcriptional regulator, lmrAB and yxaGH operons repressor
VSSSPARIPLKNRPTRERILRAGVHLFQAKGYHATGINEILERAKAPKGSFYHHFPGGKEALAIAAIEWIEGETIAFLDKTAAEGVAAMVMGLARYAAQGLRHAETMRGSLLAVLAQDAIPELSAVQAALRNYSQAVLDRLIAARMREGFEQAEAQSFASLSLALLQGAPVMARIEGGVTAMEQLIAQWLERQS